MPKIRVFLLTLVLLMVMAMGVEAQTAPVISSITPSSAVPGTVVTITGTGFGASQGLSGTLAFGGVPASQRVTASSWSAQKIVVTVPSGAITGNVVVTVAGRVSNSMPLTVTPVITGVSPSSAVEGKLVSIVGKGFGASALAGNSIISFNGVVAAASTWTSSSITVRVPGGVAAGTVTVTVAGQTSMASPSSVAMFTPTPVINTLAPTTATAGATVTISGSSFGATQGTSTISFSGTSAVASSWSDTSIVTTVPAAASSGAVVVAVNGVPSAGVTFTLTPSISTVTPNPGLAGSPVTITGNNFGATQGSSTITFNGTTAVVTNWSNTSITATVPGNVTPGNVLVRVNGVPSNGIAFALPPPYQFSLSYAPDGDVLSAQDSVNGNWNYTYDDFNRLVTASNSNPQQGLSYAYDQYGNRWQQNVTAGSGNSSQLTFSSSATAVRNGNCLHRVGLTNQPDGYCFDAAGNLLNDGQHSYTYDAENRVIAVDGGQTANYDYDGDGERIRKIAGGSTSEYLYDVSGRVITELSASGTWNRSEIYAGARHIGTYSNGTTYFVQADWLGTERTRVLPTGDVYETCSSLPFGDGLHCTGASDPSPNHVTGKPRDTESGLDYFGARYYASSLGRFATPDWAIRPTNVPYARFVDPQSLNLYAYVGDRPTIMEDVDGHFRAETMQDRERLDKVDKYVSASSGSAEGAAVVSDLKFEILKVPEGQPDPSHLSAAFSAIDELGSTEYAFSSALRSNGYTGDYGPNTDKCNIFVAEAYAVGAHRGWDGTAGFPTNATALGNHYPPVANDLGSTRAIPGLAVVGAATDQRIGDIVAFHSLHGEGHSSIFVGGSSVIYAGASIVKTNTIPNTRHLLNSQGHTVDQITTRRMVP
ncbi:MAG: repeat-associated core domain protein [Candidatus Sulfotelmatobacter sp.]|nr:repeat-associated core domain protein [Candidatus Sulfotelmatobacter sp.]